MLSILLPLYNYDCRELINCLHKQALQCEIPFEIIAIEDGSESFTELNESACNEAGATYVRLSHNIGRSAIRNKLADEASYQWLLFMDCDSIIPNDDFIKKYVQCCIDNKYKVHCGGTVLPKREIIDDEYVLHWKVGTTKEASACDNDKKRHFFSNNFLIHKSVFKTVTFNEKLRKYGFEDTLFGIELKDSGFEIHNFNNPVLHEGLNVNSIYIQRTNESLNNIKTLYLDLLTESQARDIKVLKSYLKVKRLKLDAPISLGFKLVKRPILNNLMSRNPSMLLLDIYKMGFLVNLFRQERKVQIQ